MIGVFGIDGGGCDFYLVGARAGELAGGGVDDQLDFLVFEQVYRVRPAFGELENTLNRQPRLFRRPPLPSVAISSKPRLANCFATCGDFLFVRVADADENLPPTGSGEPAAICDFA